jgi:hypothetical protein
MAKLPLQRTIVVNEDGTMADAWYFALDRLFNGADPDSIKSIVSGANERYQQIDRIVAGTEPVADVLISGRGNVTDALDATADTVADTTTGSGSLAVVASPTFASGSRSGPGAVTTGSITYTVSNGTGPYTASFTNTSGDTFTVNNTSFTGATLTTSFDITIVSGGAPNAVYKLTVTDTSDSSTCTVSVYLSAYDTNGISA